MNYMKIKKNSIANFAGVSVSLYVSGCKFYCKGCFNRSSWNPKSGDEFTDEVKKEIFDELKKAYYDNFVILGGEPLLKHNIKDVTELAKEVCSDREYKVITLMSKSNMSYEECAKCLNTTVLSVNGCRNKAITKIRRYFA
jgi:organic radical activating enzyme